MIKDRDKYKDTIYIFQAWAPAGGGGQEGALAPPPLEIQKYRGPHKDNLTSKIFF